MLGKVDFSLPSSRKTAKHDLTIFHYNQHYHSPCCRAICEALSRQIVGMRGTKSPGRLQTWRGFLVLEKTMSFVTKIF